MNDHELICERFPEHLAAAVPAVVAPREFRAFPKIPRFRSVVCTVTEKIDGTNACVYVPEDPAEPIKAGKRTSWCTPERDNMGFARFVYDNADALRRLGPGTHWGEWWGAGIQRRYGLQEKRLTLFGVDRFSGGLPSDLPECVSLVPVLYRGSLDTLEINRVVAKLFRDGSVVVPGWATPEGVIISYEGQRWKITDHGDKAKGREEHIRAIIGTLETTVVSENYMAIYGHDGVGVTHQETIPATSTVAEIYTCNRKVAERILTADDERKNS